MPCSVFCWPIFTARNLRRPEGQVVDVAIYEAVFNMLEAIVPEFDGAGVVRQPSGSTLTGIVPTNTYVCRDGKYVIIGGNGDSIFRRLMHTAGRPDMAEDHGWQTMPDASDTKSLSMPPSLPGQRLWRQPQCSTNWLPRRCRPGRSIASPI